MYTIIQWRILLALRLFTAYIPNICLQMFQKYFKNGINAYHTFARGMLYRQPLHQILFPSYGINEYR